MGWINRRTVGWTAGVLLLAIVGVCILVNRSIARYYQGLLTRDQMRSLSHAIKEQFAERGELPKTSTDALGHEHREGLRTLVALDMRGMESPNRPPKDLWSPRFESIRWYAEDKFGILVSVGPDGILEITPPMIEGLTPDKVEARLSAITYDPTNGTGSPGDVWLLVVPETKR